jgi:hypothetical protein
LFWKLIQHRLYYHFIKPVQARVYFGKYFKIGSTKGYHMATKTVEQKKLARLEKMSDLLDTAFEIPGTTIRIGFDGLLGLIPGIGDLAGMALSTYIILESARIGIPRRAVLKMVFNVLLETAIGAIPVLGDIFDIYFKANRRNVTLLRRYVQPV